MFEIIQEAALPKLSQTSLFTKFEQSSGISKSVRNELQQAKQNMVLPKDIPEILSLMKLNGDPIVKKAITYYEKGNIVIIHNKATSKIPTSLPFIIAASGNKPVAYIFADKFVNNIKSPTEYTSLMAVMEAAYLALLLYLKPNSFIMNRPLMLTLGTIYTDMVTMPLEQKLYMKGDNLVKARLYTFAYFYKMIDGNNITASSIPYKRIISDKIDDSMFKQIVEDVKALPDNSFMGLIGLITKINPVRYKDLSVMYLTYFTSACGVSLIFALENLGYLFMLVSSSMYKTPVTAFGLNKVVNMTCRKTVTLLASIGSNG